jgi:hypothetical protein
MSRGSPRAILREISCSAIRQQFSHGYLILPSQTIRTQKKKGMASAIPLLSLAVRDYWPEAAV